MTLPLVTSGYGNGPPHRPGRRCRHPRPVADAYLATLLGAEHASTRRTYGRILRRVVTEFGAETLPDDIGAGRFAEWFGSQWAGRSPSTWNVSLDAVRSAAAYWQRQGWLAGDLSRMLVPRRPRPDRDRALSRSEVDQLPTRKDISLRERTLWRMLYETAARSAEVLALDAGDLDLPDRCARVRRKGGAIDIIVWQTGTARLLKGHTTGPVFVTERKARVPLPAADLDEHGRARLSYQQAAALFTKASGRATLHHLRHSALAHDAEDGTGTPMLMKRSGHASVRSLARYARVSAEALMRRQAERDPARRR